MRRKAVVYCNRSLASKLVRKLKFKLEAAKDNAHDLRPDAVSYQRLIKYLPEPILVHDEECILFANQAGLRILGITEAELSLNATLQLYVHPDYWELSQQRLLQALSTDEPNEFCESKLVSVSGTVIDVEVSSTRIREFPGKGVVVQSVFRDIRERKKEEEALIQSEKLSVVGQMAAGIAHEIRNPLTSLIGFSKFLKTRIDDYHEYFEIMLVELDRINSIVQEFMALAKPQANQFRRHDLIRKIKGVLTLLETQAIMNNVELAAGFDADTVEVLCEENQLKQVFVNVLKNAIESMPHGGVVTIDVKSMDPEQIIVTIADQGLGIPEEQLPLLGDPFFTTKEDGTGLGLMICYRIIEGHHGKITISSIHGKGTTVTIVLPKNG